MVWRSELTPSVAAKCLQLKPQRSTHPFIAYSLEHPHPVLLAPLVDLDQGAPEEGPGAPLVHPECRRARLFEPISQQHIITIVVATSEKRVAKSGVVSMKHIFIRSHHTPDESISHPDAVEASAWLQAFSLPKAHAQSCEK